ncbi:MAG: hypothetical protein PHW53_05015 [Patescibacteria group bacterium]|nr:hypothetical protein [Patescibacteria group bacterium]
MPQKRSPINPGTKYGMLTIISETTDHICPSGYRSRRVVCICDCGKEHIAILKNIVSGSIISCGCFRDKKLAKVQMTHNMSNTSEYSIWRGIKKRCLTEKSTNYIYYGGRGIMICDRWRNSFENFFADMGARPSINHSIDRKDNMLGYSAENCRWSTVKEQANNKRNNIILEFNRESLNVTQWAEKLGIDRMRIFNRIDRGWSIEKILTTPIQHKTSRTNRCDILYKHDGVELTAREWAKMANVAHDVFYKRLIRGWTIEDALS